MIISCRTKSPAPDGQVAMEIAAVLDRRAAHASPPVDIAVTDSVALGIAALFSSPTHSGQVMDRFARTGTVDSQELIKAARFEQGFASPEGHAALHCLIGWARSREHRSRVHASQT